MRASLGVLSQPEQVDDDDGDGDDNQFIWDGS